MNKRTANKELTKDWWTTGRWTKGRRINVEKIWMIKR